MTCTRARGGFTIDRWTIDGRARNKTEHDDDFSTSTHKAAAREKDMGGGGGK